MERRAGRTLGRWKVTEVRIFCARTPLVPLRTAFLAALALTSWGFPPTGRRRANGASGRVEEEGREGFGEGGEGFVGGS